MGFSETRIYTKQCITHMSDADEWYKIIRQPEIQHIFSGDNNYIVAESGKPIIFTDLGIHEAKPLYKHQLPPNKSAVYRLMIRIVVYPLNRLNELPKYGGQVLAKYICHQNKKCNNYFIV